jgi:hypothetical protein
VRVQVTNSSSLLQVNRSELRQVVVKVGSNDSIHPGEVQPRHPRYHHESELNRGDGHGHKYLAESREAQHTAKQLQWKRVGRTVQLHNNSKSVQSHWMIEPIQPLLLIQQVSNWLQVSFVARTALGIAVCGGGACWGIKQEETAWGIAMLMFLMFSTSILMSALNKMLVEELHAPYTIVLLQCLASVFMQLVTQSDALKKMLWTEEVGEASSESSSFQMQILYYAPCALFLFPASLISSMVAFDYVSISVMTLFRNLAPLVLFPIEYMVFPPNLRPQATLQVFMSIFVMTAGAVLYAYAVDVDFSTLLGIMLVLLNCFFTTAEKVAVRLLLTGRCKTWSPQFCVFLNNIFALVPLSIIIPFWEPHGVEACKHLTIQGKLDLMISGMVSVILGQSIIGLQKSITSLSVIIAQNGLKIGLILVGVVMFGDPCTALSTLACIINLSGVMWYALEATGRSRTK